MQPGAPVVSTPDNIVARWKIRKGNLQEGMAQADLVVENTFTVPFVEHAYIEPEAGVAWIDERNVVNIRICTQVVEHFRSIALALNIPQNRLHIQGTMVGGGFGGKEDITVEIFLGLLTLHTHRPVRIEYSREESIQAHSKRHPFIITHRTGVTRDGRITAAEIKMVANSGAYVYLSPYVLLYATATATGHCPVGEQLCAVGLTKRLGRRPDGKNAVFPSVVRVAADPWIRGIRKHPGDKANRILDEIETCCREGENSFSAGIGDRLYQEFRLDGHILYPSRLARAKEDLKDISDLDKDNPYKDDPVKLNQIENAINQLQNKDDCGLGLGEPNQYLAILKADGDRMGKALSAIDSFGHHRAFSGLLAEFASDAKKIIEEEHHGCMVFSGGDDILAFLPLDTCLDAARALHDGFREKGEKLTALQGDSGIPLTLSVGIAIGHYLEPLENLLNFGNEAEKAAKDGRDAQDERDGLAVHIYPRSGAPIKIREKWLPEKANGLDERLRKWAKMHCENKLPDSAAYEMRELAEDYKDWKTSSKDEEDKLRDLIASDALRLLKRKTGILEQDQFQKEDLKGMLMNAEPYQAISRMASELILARRIAVAMKQAGDKKSPKQARQTQEVA